MSLLILLGYAGYLLFAYQFAIRRPSAFRAGVPASIHGAWGKGGLCRYTVLAAWLLVAVIGLALRGNPQMTGFSDVVLLLVLLAQAGLLLFDLVCASDTPAATLTPSQAIAKAEASLPGNQLQEQEETLLKLADQNTQLGLKLHEAQDRLEQTRRERDEAVARGNKLTEQNLALRSHRVSGFSEKTPGEMTATEMDRYRERLAAELRKVDQHRRTITVKSGGGNNGDEDLFGGTQG